MQLHQCPHQRQSQAQPPVGPAERPRPLSEDLEDLILEFTGDADTRVANADRDRFGVGGDVEPELSVRLRILHRVGEEIDDHLGQTQRIAQHPDVAGGRQRDGELVLLFFDDPTDAVGRPLTDLGHVDGSAFDVELSGYDARGIEQVVEQASHVGDLPLDHLHGADLPFRRRRLGSQQRHGVADGAHRVSQLVAQHGDPLVLSPGIFPQLLGAPLCVKLRVATVGDVLERQHDEAFGAVRAIDAADVGQHHPIPGPDLEIIDVRAVGKHRLHDLLQGGYVPRRVPCAREGRARGRIDTVEVLPECPVRRHDPKVSIEHEHRGAHRLDDRLGVDAGGLARLGGPLLLRHVGERDADTRHRIVFSSVGRHGADVGAAILGDDLARVRLERGQNLLSPVRRLSVDEALLDVLDGSADVGGNQMHQACRRRREAPDTQIPVEENRRDARVHEQGIQVGVRFP